MFVINMDPSSTLPSRNGGMDTSSLIEENRAEWEDCFLTISIQALTFVFQAQSLRFKDLNPQQKIFAFFKDLGETPSSHPTSRFYGYAIPSRPHLTNGVGSWAGGADMSSVILYMIEGPSLD
jgi:hypothetical protein